MMRAITLWQPYATLIFAGAKLHETRPWRAPGSLIGQRIVIHAAKKIPARNPALETLCDEVLGDGWLERLPYGCGLGTVLLANSLSMEEASPVNAGDRIAGDWSEGRFAWRLSDPKQFPRPIPRRGFQRVWIWGDE